LYSTEKDLSLYIYMYN